MKKDTLKEISNETYYVEKNCTYKKGIGKICDFHITKLTVYEKFDKPISFEITLKSKEETLTKNFLISYLHDPINWFYDGFFDKGFRVTTTKKNFEESMVEIINLILDNDEHDTEDEYIGWKTENLSGINFQNSEYYFGRFEDPGESILPEDFKNKPQNYLYEYIDLAPTTITAPLFSYMLLSLLTSLKIFGTDTRANFHVTITGGSEDLRKKFALFCTNVYKRDPSFTSSEYKSFHINPRDTTTDIRSKAKYAKDCVLIALEPDKRHLKTLLQEIYQSNVIDEKQPIENLLLVTREHVEKTSTHNTLIIQLNNEHNTKKIEDYFKINEPIPLEDHLMSCVYYFLTKLRNKVHENKNYVRNKFINHRDMFLEYMVTSDLSETAREVAQPLIFAFQLYCKLFKFRPTSTDEDFKYEQMIMNATNAIISAAKNSFPVKGYVTDSDFEKAKSVCKQLDSFFTSTDKGTPKNKDLVGKIGCEEGVTEKRVWFDDEYIFIAQKRANELLKLTDGNKNFNTQVKYALAKHDIIKKYIKADGKPEYTVHLQKPLYDNKKSKLRYLAFNREICKKYDLFPNIEKIMEHIKIDVK